MSDNTDQDGIAFDGGAESVELAASVDRQDGVLGSLEGGSTSLSATQIPEREFLLEVVRRAPLLSALRKRSVTAAEIADSVDMSRSTVHRATISLEEHNMIEQSDGEYSLTTTGEMITETMADFDTRVGTTMALEPFLNNIDMDDVPIEHFVNAKITRPSPRQPHVSIQRIVELIEQSETLQMLSTVLSPIYVDVGYREMTDGMHIEAVFDEEVIEIMLSQYAEKAAETIQTGNFDVFVHEGLPFELFILDDRIGMAAHDEHGIAKLLVECDAPEAMKWAHDVYDQHHADADPLLMREQ